MNSLAVQAIKLDQVGDWSVTKLDILRKYAGAYSRILTDRGFYHIYIDGFAGAGQHLLKRTQEPIPGSPINALHVQPPFRELHLVDANPSRVASLQNFTREFDHVHVYGGDANHVLLSQVFPNVQFRNYRRALCILDPYGMHLDWRVIAEAAKMKTIEIFLNFPIMDMNRNALLWDCTKSLI